jgi:dihydrofolate reductase
MTISHVVAMSENRVIGNHGGLPWHLPEDFKFFKRLTMGHAMIMGRKTYESIGRPLPGRLTLVVTRQLGLVPPAQAQYCSSLAAALAAASAARGEWGDEVFVVGGGELYRESMPLVDRVYLTLVHRQVAGDTTYPELPTRLRRVREEQGPGGACTWQVYER